MAEQVDELFDVKSAFYVGAYQQCIKNCQTARLSDPALAVEKDGYMYRAYLAQVCLLFKLILTANWGLFGYF